jgi:hypothetical protein
VASVLSTIRGTRALRAIAAMAARSVMRPPGLAIDSTKIALVLGDSAASKLSGFSASAHTTCQPKDLKEWLNWLIEPP